MNASRFMPLPRRRFVAGIATLAAFAVDAAAKARPLRIFAAASLTDALEQAAALYMAAGHDKPVLNFAASSTLARQIEHGAAADIFISADEAWMDYLAERKLIDISTRRSPFSNKLVLVTPADQPLALNIVSGFDLAGALAGGKLAMADPESVPAGRYGRAALQNLKIWNSVEGSVVRAENVRAALRFVQTGEARAGIVYLTDQMAAGGKVALAGEFPPASYPHISYPMAVVKGGRKSEAIAFENFLRTPEARAAFTRLGFGLQ